MKYAPLLYVVVSFSLLAGCKKSTEFTRTGRIRFEFAHTVKGKPLLTDTMIYATTSGYLYKVADLQYFISGITLYHAKGRPVLINTDGGIHYTDARLPQTLEWNPGDGLLAGSYDSLTFVFGIDAEKNISNRFPDPPERDMAWPDILGGGYHYMKMNLMYHLPGTTGTKPFMFHLGIGQVYSSVVPNPDSITGFLQNFFQVSLPVPFTVTGGTVVTARCTMMVDKWFDGVELFDFEDYPRGIMQYQPGMHKACVNGRHVFTGSIL